MTLACIKTHFLNLAKNKEQIYFFSFCPKEGNNSTNNNQAQLSCVVEFQSLVLEKKIIRYIFIFSRCSQQHLNSWNNRKTQLGNTIVQLSCKVYKSSWFWSLGNLCSLLSHSDKKEVNF